jgi:uncharacterized protein
MYNQGDRSALTKPKRMSREVLRAMLASCIAYAESKKIPRIQFVFHGGEPLMAGIGFFEDFVSEARASVRSVNVEILFTVQTNGILLDERWCQFFLQERINIGISIDGLEETHDRHRVTHSGSGTYHSVVRGLQCAQSHGLHTTILLVIDPNSSPLDAYNQFCRLAPNQLDLILPEACHDNPPQQGSKSDGESAYSDWLIAFFNFWHSSERPAFRVPFFDRVLRWILFSDFQYITPVHDERNMIIIDTDGEISQLDLLRAAIPGASNTGYFVQKHKIEDALIGNPIRLKYPNMDNLPEPCRFCEVVGICGGGAASTRFRHSNGFDNPSVYCADLKAFIQNAQHYCHQTRKIDLARLLGALE